MSHEVPMNEAKIVSVTPLSGSKLMLQFSHGERKVFDVALGMTDRVRLMNCMSRAIQ